MPKREHLGQKTENKILLLNSVHTRPRQENFEKNRTKIQKIIKPLPGIIFSQNGRRLAEKLKKKILLQNSVHTRPGQENSEKKIVKKFEKL